MTKVTMPANALQRAYLMGRDADTELGGVSTHGYFEFTGPACHPRRLQDALDEAVVAHAALRTTVTGRELSIADAPGAFPLAVHDLRGCTRTEIDRTMQQLRADQCSAVRQGWPLFGVTLVLEDDDHSRLLLDADGLAVDLESIRALIEEIAARAAGRAVVDALTGPPGPPPPDGRASAWWAERLLELPPPPRLPLSRSPSEVTTTRFMGRHELLPSRVWRAAREAARARGITPSGLALSVFAETLRRCGAGTRFTVAAPTRSASKQGAAIGQFAGIVPLAVDWSGSDPVARARTAQRALMSAAMRASGAGPGLLAELTRVRGLGLSAPLPVVFTSGIGLPGLMAPPGWQLDTLTSQTAGVWLDAQATETPDGLMVHWDTVDEVIGAEHADAWFATHLELWYAHTESRIWEAPQSAEADAGPAPAHRGPLPWTPLVRPRGPLEELLSLAWSTALDAWPIGRNDDLLALGATPDRAARCTEWLTEWFGQEIIASAELASATTVAELAEHVETAHPNLPMMAELSFLVAADLGDVRTSVPTVPAPAASPRFRYCPDPPLEMP